MAPLSEKEDSKKPLSIALVDDIRLKSEDLAHLSGLGDYVESWLLKINPEIANLNRLITAYNDETNRDAQKERLNRIKEKFQYIQDIIPGNVISRLSDFQDKIHNQLFSEIKTQERELQPPPPQTNLNAPTFQEVLDGMSYAELSQFMKYLSYGKKYLADIRNLYPTENQSEEANRYRRFMETHTLRFLGGGNSQNFSLIHDSTQKTSVIKLEYRMDNPKQTERDLRKEAALEQHFPKNGPERQSAFENKHGQRVTCNVFQTELVTGGDLWSYAQTFKSPEASVHQAVDVYDQMAKLFITMEQANVAFPDAKNSNWLINDKGILILADTKSYLPTEKGALVLNHVDDEFGYGLITTPGMRFPEMNQSWDAPIDVSAMHSYLYGKNLYHFVTKCDAAALNNPDTFNFELPAFKTLEGRIIADLIQQTTKRSPKDRMTLTRARERLQEARNIIEIKALCHKQIRTLIDANPEKTRYYTSLQEKLDHAKTLSSLESTTKFIHQEHSNLTNEVIKQYRELRSNIVGILFDFNNGLVWFFDDHNQDDIAPQTANLQALNQKIKFLKCQNETMDELLTIQQHPLFKTLSDSQRNEMQTYIEQTFEEILKETNITALEEAREKLWNKDEMENHLKHVIFSQLKSECETLLNGIAALDPSKIKACNKMREKINNAETIEEMQALEKPIRLGYERIRVEKSMAELQTTLWKITHGFDKHLHQLKKEESKHHEDSQALKKMAQQMDYQRSGVQAMFKIMEDIDFNHIPNDAKKEIKDILTYAINKILNERDLEKLERGKKGNWNHVNIRADIKKIIATTAEKSASQKSTDYKTAIQEIKTGSSQETSEHTSRKEGPTPK